MKSPTTHYRLLVNSLKKARLIIRGVNKLGCTTDLQHLKLQAYILLCHAALEQYIEDLALSAAKSARDIYVKKGVVTKTLLGKSCKTLRNVWYMSACNGILTGHEAKQP